MNKEICLATSNAGKLQEFRELLAPMGFLVYSPGDLNVESSPLENGTTYRENAYIKALDLAKKVPFPVIADDSGLEIEALGNEPGLHTARYAKENGGFPKVFDVVLSRLEGKTNRKAAFHCSICYLASPSSKPLYFDGVCPGEILLAPHGKAGFGYDPIFHSEEANIDFGVASEDIKNAYSHRGKAITKLKVFLLLDY